MSTRRVKAGERRLQNGWASAPEFDDLRGLSGTAVALKAELLDNPQAKSLLYFLQARSLKIGAKGIARELIEMFPERIASPAMVKYGCVPVKPAKRLTQEQRDEINNELTGYNEQAERSAAAMLRRMYEPPKPCESTLEAFISECREKADQNLTSLLERLCCDPTLAVTSDSGEAARYEGIAKIVFEDTELQEQTSERFDWVKPVYFHDVLGALWEYQKRCVASVRENFVETSIGTVVFEALDYALETGRSALIEGNSGIGKSTSVEAWCEMHSDRARLVKLKGITHRTGFFREVAKACGLARGTALSPAKIQMRVEQFLQRSKIMLVIDEGQYLFSPGNRVYTPPELINWLMTACYNEGVPFAISATSEFRKRRAIVEKNTTWQSEQLRRRIRRFFSLPEKPTKEDLFAVAAMLLPGHERRAVEYVVGYSMTSGGFFQAITDVIDDARLIARREAREKITFADLKAAVQEWRSPSDAALQRVFEKPQPGRSRRTQSSADSREQPILEPNNGRLNARLASVKVPALEEISAIQD